MTIMQFRDTFAAELQSMTRSQHFWNWIFPSALLGVLMIFFYSGIPALHEIVNPEQNREWGLIENIQLVIVATILGVAARAGITKKPTLQKIGFGLISVFAVFVFLEEIDYGSHLVEYVTGTGKSQLAKVTGVYNLHNYAPSTAKLIKRSVYGLMLLLFVVAPFLQSWFRNGVIRYLIPNPRIAIIAILTIFFEIAARLLVRLSGMQLEELGMDIGEFSEILIYYIFLVYVWQLAFEKEWPDAGSIR